jgi:hypothetical protein
LDLIYLILVYFYCFVVLDEDDSFETFETNNLNKFDISVWYSVSLRFMLLLL